MDITSLENIGFTLKSSYKNDKVHNAEWYSILDSNTCTRVKKCTMWKKTKVVDYAPCCLRTIASSFKCMIPYHRHLDCWNLVNSGLSVNIYTYRWGVGNACCELVNKAQKKKLLLTLNETEIQRIIKPQLIKIIIIISSIWPHYWYKKILV